MPVLYLASKSPRRREILAGMGISDIEVIHAGPSVLTAFEGDETQHDGESPQDYVVRTACEKARQAMDRIAAEARVGSRHRGDLRRRNTGKTGGCREGSSFHAETLGAYP